MSVGRFEVGDAWVVLHVDDGSARRDAARVKREIERTIGTPNVKPNVDQAHARREGKKAGAEIDRGIGKPDVKPRVDPRNAKNEGRKFGFALGASIAATAGSYLAATKIVDFVKGSIAEAREAQKVGAQTAAVIKSTGGAAQITQGQVEGLADRLSKLTGIDDELIQSHENVLLTFTKVHGKIFTEAVPLIEDYATAMKIDGKQAAVQLGKALQDPVKGINAMTRAGVTFSQQQKDQIKDMVAHGNLVGAQRIILAEVRKEFQGSAAAQATAADKQKVAWENLKETVGKFILPMLDKIETAMTNKVIPGIVHFVNGIAGVTEKGNKLNEWGRAARSILATLIGTFISMGKVVLAVVGWFARHTTIAKVLLVTIAGLVVVHRAYLVTVRTVALVVRLWTAAQIALSVVMKAGALISYAGFVARYLAVTKLSVVVTKAWTIAQRALNLAMRLNPIGLIITAIALLVIGIIYAYKHFTGFRNVVNAVGRAIVIAFKAMGTWGVWLWQHALLPAIRGIAAGWNWLWSKVLRPVSQFIVAYVRMVGATISWLWTHVASPVFRFIGNAWKGVGTVIKVTVIVMITYWRTLAATAQWMWNKVLMPVFRFIGNAWKGVGTLIGTIGAAIRNAFQLIYNKGAWLGARIKDIANAISGTWNKLRQATINTFTSMRDGIGKVWDGVKAKVRAPIAAVVDVVYNHGIVSFWNATVGKIPGISKLPTVTVPQFKAAGGPIHGGSTGYDSVPVVAMPGEHVWTAKEVRMFGGHGRMEQARRMVKDGFPTYADGGPIGWLKNSAKWVGGKAKNLVLGGIMKTLQPLIDHTRSAISGIGGKDDWGKTVRGLPTALLDAAIAKVKEGDVAPSEGGWAGGGIPGIEHWLKAQDHKPYVWASAGPGGYDCSGLVSAVWNLVHGKNPYHHTFSTANEANFFKGPPGGLFSVGWAGPGERGGGSVGHTAGVFNGIPFESGGSHGNVSVGHNNVTPLSAFAHRASLAGAERMIHAHQVAFEGTAPGGTLATWIYAALKKTGHPTSWAAPLHTLIMRESGGNPHAINNSDSNARAGIASRGLAQVIPPTFAANHEPGTSMNIFDPIANLSAALNYITRRYGSIFNVQQANAHMPPMGYDAGGWLPHGGIGVNTSGRPEPVFTDEQWRILKANVGGGMRIDKVIIDAKSVKEFNSVIDFFKKVDQTARAGVRK